MWGIDMSKVYLDDSVLTDIADAIREKTGESGLITPADMPTEIESISGGSTKLSEITMAGCNGLLSTPQTGTNFFLDPENVSYPFTIHVLETTPGAGTGTSGGYLAQGTKDLSNYILDFSQIPETMSYNLHGVNIGYMFYNSLCETAEDLPQFVWDENKTIYIASTYPFANCYYLKNISQNMKDFLIYAIKSSVLLRPSSIGANPGMNAYNLEDISYLTEGLRGITYTGSSSLYTSFNLQHNYMIKTITIPQIKGSDKTVGYTINFTITKCCPRHIVFEPFTYDDTFCPKSGDISLQNMSNSDVSTIKPYLDKMGRLFVASNAAAVANVDNSNAWAGNALYISYNIDSIKETFASLPDVTKSAYTGTKGTFTIRLSKVQGQNTYVNNQGSAQYLTAEDQAVATAKGWTITIS